MAVDIIEVSSWSPFWNWMSGNDSNRWLSASWELRTWISQQVRWVWPQ